jgi:Cd2+/Zn2+-exporting ATPase
MSDDCCTTTVTPAPPAVAAQRPQAGGQEIGSLLRQRAQPLTRLAISGLALSAGAVLGWLAFPQAAIVAFAAAIAVCLPSLAKRAWTSAMRRALDINVLMVVAVAGAAALGEWFEAATVVWLFGVAQELEWFSMARARHAIRTLMAVAPATARIRRHNVDHQVPVADVRVGDLVVVLPGERMPVDGVVMTGETVFDESSVTGESWPVPKAPGSEVFSGTINGTGAIEVTTRRLAADSTIARIIHLVEEAQRQRAPVQTFVDRFARLYTPSVVLLALAVVMVGPLATGGVAGWTAHFSVWSYRALALLVVACPCALVISTPVAIVSALTAAARGGVLIKGGATLERLASVRSVAFDKTGTLTHGHITVTDVLGLDGSSADSVLGIAAALEARSEHPIGRAIVHRARIAGLDVEPGAAFRALPGLGAEATVAEAPAIVGSHRLFEDRQLCTPALHACIDEVESRGGTPVLVGHDGMPLGVIGLSDEMRTGGRDAVTSLRDLGVDRVVLLTGDVKANAARALAGAGLDEAHAELLPAQKVEAIQALRDRYGPVAMVGDGINDAPALAAADVGIAMGAAGSDVALETADVVLMSDDLSKLPFALRLGRVALANIRQNVTIALSLKIAFVVLAAFGLATMWMAIVADTGASLIVTANSLRLLRQK